MREDNLVRKRIVFYGDVQGVGFRYRANYSASMCGVTGWVKNEWDGSVILEAQGTESQISEMIKMLNNSRYIDIRNMDVKEISLLEYESGFHIR